MITFFGGLLLFVVLCGVLWAVAVVVMAMPAEPKRRRRRRAPAGEERNQ